MQLLRSKAIVLIILTNYIAFFIIISMHVFNFLLLFDSGKNMKITEICKKKIPLKKDSDVNIISEIKYF